MTSITLIKIALASKIADKTNAYLEKKSAKIGKEIARNLDAVDK